MSALHRFLLLSSVALVTSAVRAAVVALPDHPTAVEKSAAKELADGIGRLRGTVPPIVCESAAADRTDVFYVGATAHAATVTNAVGVASWKYD